MKKLTAKDIDTISKSELADMLNVAIDAVRAAERKMKDFEARIIESEAAIEKKINDALEQLRYREQYRPRRTFPSPSDHTYDPNIWYQTNTTTGTLSGGGSWPYSVGTTYTTYTTPEEATIGLDNYTSDYKIDDTSSTTSTPLPKKNK